MAVLDQFKNFIRHGKAAREGGEVSGLESAAASTQAARAALATSLVFCSRGKRQHVHCRVTLILFFGNVPRSHLCLLRFPT